MRVRAFVLSILLAASMAAPASATEGPIDIGSGVAEGINDRGIVVGTTPDGTGWMWQRGRRTDLGTLGGAWTRPRAVNQGGQVVGASENADGFERAFLWRNGRMTDLGTVGGERSEALAINTRGEVVGWSENGDGHRRAFVWRNGRMTDLGPGVARDINRFGEIVGGSVMWDRRHRSTDLTGYLPDLGTHISSVEARAINDSGVIVGSFYDGEGWGFRLDGIDAEVAVLLDRRGYWGIPDALNNAGIAVGCGLDENDDCHAAAWGQDGRVYAAMPCLQLTGPGPSGCGASDLNRDGHAVGWSHLGTWEDGDVELRAVLWRLP